MSKDWRKEVSHVRDLFLMENGVCNPLIIKGEKIAISQICPERA